MPPSTTCPKIWCTGDAPDLRVTLTPKPSKPTTLMGMIPVRAFINQDALCACWGPALERIRMESTRWAGTDKQSPRRRGSPGNSGAGVGLAELGLGEAGSPRDRDIPLRNVTKRCLRRCLHRFSTSQVGEHRKSGTVGTKSILLRNINKRPLRGSSSIPELCEAE